MSAWFLDSELSTCLQSHVINFNYHIAEDKILMIQLLRLFGGGEFGEWPNNVKWILIIL